MEWINPPEKFRILQILTQSDQLQTADNRRNLLRFCGLEKYSGLVQLDKPAEQFAISVISTLSNVSLTVESSRKIGLVVFLDNLSQLDSSLSDEDKDFIQQLITKGEPGKAAPVIQPQQSTKMMEQSQFPVKRDQVFISYSHKDREWFEKLQTMLQPMMRRQIISVWDDTRIKTGAKWRDEIQKALAAAKVAVLMVSREFLKSNFIAEHELPPLLEAAEREGLKIIWVCVNTCMYEETEIELFQAAHDVFRPLDSLTEAELYPVIKRICQDIKQAANEPTN